MITQVYNKAAWVSILLRVQGSQGMTKQLALTFCVEPYLGLEGWILNTPFIKWETMGRLLNSVEPTSLRNALPAESYWPVFQIFLCVTKDIRNARTTDTRSWNGMGTRELVHPYPPGAWVPLLGGCFPQSQRDVRFPLKGPLLGKDPC